MSPLANRVELEGYELLQKDEQGNLVSRLQRAGPAGSRPRCRRRLVLARTGPG